MSVQAPQLALVAQASPVPPPEQEDGYQTQLAQEPSIGPDDDPCAHVLVAGHQPQEASPVQPPQAVAAAHGSLPGVEHTPDSQVRPEQQSSFAVHVWELVRQPQVPPEQSMDPQQSRLEVQRRPGSLQQMVVDGLARQLRPVQHSEARVHAVWATPQVPPDVPPSRGVGPASLVPVPDLRHLPVMHVRPVRHPVSGQQASSTPPHTIVASHAPATHRPLEQSMPQRPQLRGSVRVSMQAREQHMRPVPVQVSPAQQVSPEPPQRMVSLTQRPLVHMRPVLHRVPSQQGSRAPPHVGAEPHVPAVQVRPDAHRLLSQQGSRAPPQAAGRAHTLRSQTRPDPQVSPMQQASRSLPQRAGGISQLLPIQTRPVSQAPPEQQLMPARPHEARAVHVPAEQVSPLSHTVPRQHGCRSAPQVGVSMPESGRRRIVPASRRPASVALSPEAQPTTVSRDAMAAMRSMGGPPGLVRPV